MVSQSENSNFSEMGEMVYVKEQNINSFDDGYYLSSDTINLKDGYVSVNKIDGAYLSVAEFIKLMDKIYKDTYFRAEEIIMQDGEEFEENQKYYLYPSEESYKENKFLRVKLKFLESQANIVGKSYSNWKTR